VSEALFPLIERWTSGRRALVTGGAILLVLAVGFFNPIFRANATFSDVAAHQTVIWPWAATPNGFSDTSPVSDEADSIYPWGVFGARAIRSGTVPLWNPDSLAGTPFLTNGLGSPVYPLRVVLDVLFSASWVHDLMMLLQMYVSGVAMFALMRAFRTGFTGSLLAAVAWMFASFNLLWIQFEFVEAFAAFLPLGLLCAYLASERRSWWWASFGGLALAASALGSSLQFAGELIAVIALFAACLALRELRATWPDRRRSVGVVGRPLLMGVLAVGLSAPVTIPSYVLSHSLGRASVSLAGVESRPVTLQHFLRTFVAPSLPTTELTLFQATWVGAAVAALALFGFLALPLRRPGASLGRVLLIGTMLVCLGTPLTAIPYHLIPGFAYVNGLGRLLGFWAFAVALLGGLGLDRAQQLVTAHVELRIAAHRGTARLVLTGVSTLLIVFTAYQTMSYARSANPRFQPRARAYLYPETPAISAIERDASRRSPTQPQRIMPLRVANPTMYASHAMVFGIESIAGYESLAVQRTVDFWRVVEGEKAADVIASPLQTSFIANYLTPTVRYDLLPRVGVTTIFAPPNLATDPEWQKRGSRPLALTTIYSGPDGLVMNLRDAGHRAFVVHQATVVPTDAAALTRYTDPRYPWRTHVVLERADGQPAARRGSGAPTVAAALHRGLNGSTWRVATSTPGYLVVLDTWAPGWQATVNGHAAHVLHANYAFRAVEVPAGTSTVRLVYRPPGWVAGSWIAGLMLAALLVAAIVGLARRRRGTTNGG
jgi:hypothetical protein